MTDGALMSIDSVSSIQSRDFIELVRGPFIVMSRGEIADPQATALVKMLMQGRVVSTRGALGGRSHALTLDLPPLGPVFVKRYSHGGLLRALTGGRFLAVGQPRSLVEFEMLELVRSFGVNAPRPLAVIRRGAMVYGTWLVMEELLNTRSLVEIQRGDIDELHRAMEGLAEQMMLLVRNRVFHVDLHPGNVLVAPDGKVHVVDFDKARVYRGSASALRDLYLRRWRRAVIKHGLSPVLSELMSLTLRSYSE
jgi:3-deoxy-D-manno-octulosonic acid kinase